MRQALAVGVVVILAGAMLFTFTRPTDSASTGSVPHWEYARWVEKPGISIWICGSKEQYGSSMYETYLALGGQKPKTQFGKPSSKDEVMAQAGRQGWELCAVDTEGSTVYFFKRRMP